MDATTSLFSMGQRWDTLLSLLLDLDYLFTVCQKLTVQSEKRCNLQHAQQGNNNIHLSSNKPKNG